MSCGVSVNLSAIESSITAHVGKITGIAGMAGLPFVTAGLIAGMAVSNGNYLGAINIVMNTSGMLDTAWNSMRTGFDKLVADGVNAGTSVLSDDYLESIGIRATGSLSTPLESLKGKENLLLPTSPDYIGPAKATFSETLTKTVNDWGERVTKFAKDTGLSQFSGYVDINALDLAKSSLGFGASFDSCDFGVSGIGNYFQDPATGTVKLLSNYAPLLGDTTMPSPVDKLGFSATEYANFAASARINILGKNISLENVYNTFVPDTVTNLTTIAQRNVSAVAGLYDSYTLPAKGALSAGVRRLADGQTVVENQASVLTRLRTTISGRMPATEFSSVALSF
tara:strand:- start:359 stop:1375 length:1017 start_codon:yes stop_codon:yes gene_type:complete